MGGLYFNLSMAMRTLNDYKAYEYLDTARIMKNQVRDLEMKDKLERVTAVSYTHLTLPTILLV